VSPAPKPALAEMRDRLFEEVERVLSAAAERHVVRTVGGGEVTGARDEEFVAQGDLAPIRARWDAVRRKIVETIDDMPPGRLDDAVPKPSRIRTIHGVLVHAIAHAAEHAGQAELTRDLIKERDAAG